LGGGGGGGANRDRRPLELDLEDWVGFLCLAVEFWNLTNGNG
jgi:hypothetical protein